MSYIEFLIQYLSFYRRLVDAVNLTNKGKISEAIRLLRA
jgi:hypothetical protein